VVRKVIRTEATEFRYERSAQPLPKLRPWVAALDGLLLGNEGKPARERLTLMRVFEELAGQGYDGSYDAVRRYAKAWAQDRGAVTAQAFVPLSFAPGEAYQFDWSHEIVVIGGVTTTVKVAHVRLCHSRMFFVRAYSNASIAPTEDMLAHAIRRDIGVVRDHFAATRGGIERRVRSVLPIVSFIRGKEMAFGLAQRHDRLGTALKLRDWLVAELGQDTADRALSTIDDTDDQALIRRRMGFDFLAYGRTLAELDYPPLNNEADFRRLFGVFVAELAPALVDRVRRRFVDDWRGGRDLGAYVALRKLEFVEFNSAWVIEYETIDRDFVAEIAAAAADAILGPDQLSVTLPDYESVVTANRKLIMANHTRLASLIRAWCRVKNVSRPSLMDTTDPQALVRALSDKGLIDFETARAKSLPTLLARAEAWPRGMPQTDVIEDLELTDLDLQHEEREAREARRKAEAEKRTIKFDGQPIDTGRDDFATLLSSSLMSRPLKVPIGSTAVGLRGLPFRSSLPRSVAGQAQAVDMAKIGAISLRMQFAGRWELPVNG